LFQDADSVLIAERQIKYFGKGESLHMTPYSFSELGEKYIVGAVIFLYLCNFA